MKQTRIISLVAAVMIAAGMTLVAAEPSANEEELQKLFETALATGGLEYQKARDAILAHDGAADFLEKRAQDTNLVSRVIGRALQTWMRDGVANMDVSKQVVEVTVRATRRQIGDRGILGSIYDLKSDPVSRKFAKINTDVHVLLEVALKGPTLPADTQYHKNIQSLYAINCYAAGLSGLYDDPDVIPVLTMLTDENEDSLMKNAALRGLLLRDGVDTAVLIKGVEDKDEDYRRISHHHLRDITGKDFGYDAGKYRAFIETNTVDGVSQSLK